MQQCGTPVGEAPHRRLAIPTKLPDKRSRRRPYTDTLPAELENENSTGYMTYAVEVLNVTVAAPDFRTRLRVPLVRTLAPPQDFQAQVTSQGVVLSWRQGLPLRSKCRRNIDFVFARIAAKRAASSGHSCGEVAAGKTNRPSPIQKSSGRKTYEYHVETVTVVARR